MSYGAGVFVYGGSMGKSLSNNNIELLAPAGTFEALRAAVNAGADAVYLGGSAFGARAYAGNFNENELLAAIDYTHLRDKKLYLTVNTLLKDSELENELYGYLMPYYRAGLDAVIVQDWGVFDFIRSVFPGLNIHASTQMTVTGPYGAKLLYEMGASRVVLARELDINDIKEIGKNVNVEIESFVHGAMCYSYSGQCLLSSMSGDRSGNRGRCAQPCRMTYNGKYLLSMKDMCALNVIPDMAEAGVNSFKIEGRMKSSGYVAGVVSIYRKYIDKYLSDGKDGYSVSERDLTMLSDLYNRGGFSCGYYKGGKGPDMISLNRPNHQGTRALEVISSAFGSAVCTALVPLNAGDVFEIEGDFNYTVGKAFEKGSRVELRLPKNFRLKAGRKLYRIHNKNLTDKLTENYISKDKKIPISGRAELVNGSEAKLFVYKGGVCANAYGAVVQPAIKQPLAEADVYDRLNKTNETPYIFQKLEISMDENVFVANGQLNELRRNALDALTKALSGRFRRGGGTDTEETAGSGEVSKAWSGGSVKVSRTGSGDSGEEDKADCEDILQINVMLDTVRINEEIFAAVLSADVVDGIYIEEEAYEDAAMLKNAVDRIHSAGKKAYVSMPYVVRGRTVTRLAEAVSGYKDIHADAWLVRNLETAAIFKEYFGQAPLITDAGMYSSNRRAVKIYAEMFPAIIFNTLPYELTKDELKALGDAGSELVTYGSIPVMLSENCVKKTLGQCDRKNGDITITDAKGRNFRIASRCQNCYAVMYNSNPLFIAGDRSMPNDLRLGSFRLIFTDEDVNTILEVINASDLIRKGKDASIQPEGCISGHFNRSIL